ncbi:MAG TPA: alpha/beta hydrolase [Casimicrobiaceae bacterium]|nr:alpha/beta hydrolase [Casimicrobiaceae bacterium]
MSRVPPPMDMTAAEVERGYNNRAAVPEHPEWFARWAASSQAARERYRPTLDVRYGTGPKETLDLFVPAGTPRGTLLFVHGGYWRSLDKAEHAFVAGPFVEQGFAVAVPNYDLCPQVTIAEIVEETRRCIAWLVREGARHGADASTLVVSGHSAGGHLAAMMVATPASGFGLDRHPVAAAVTVSGVHDLRPLVLFSFNADFRLDDAEAARMSPALLAPASRVPVLVAVGADETGEFLRQSRLMWDAWPANRPAGDAGPLEVRGRHHFSIVHDYADPDSALTRRTLALF